MKRLSLTLRIELKLFRTAIPVHLVAILQPTVMYLLMSAILVYPTFDMNVSRASLPMGEALVNAMAEVGSPIGPNYIQPILVDQEHPDGLRQVVTLEEKGGALIASQHFGLVDSNIVKNYRNRLTAAALRLWNNSLGERAIQIEERPWLPKDMPYTLFFGMAMLPLTVTVAAAITGGVLTTQEFETGTILEYRLAPAASYLVVGARLLRLVFTGLVSAGILLIAIRLVNGMWPESAWQAALMLTPICLAAACLGMCAGLILQKSIPVFLVGLVTSFVSWLLGSAFGLAAGFNQFYEFVSRLTLNTHTVELLFPLYFGERVGEGWVSIIYLILSSGAMTALTLFLYQSKVKDRS
jgi:hypothetical protein